MITKEQIDDYILRNFPANAEGHAKKAITWAFEQMQAENERLQKELERAKNAAAIHEANATHYSAEVAELNAKLRRAAK